MVIGIKNAAKLFILSIMAGCAVFVCTLFLNFQMDLISIKDLLHSEQAMAFYEAQKSTAAVVSTLSGGCLLVTTVVMLIFYVKHYIDMHKKELGILKALGYARTKIAVNFWVFGISILIGTSIGFGGAFCMMPAFYKVQNEDRILPEVTMHFHWSLLLSLVILPAVFFAALAVVYAYFRLKMPVLMLIKDNYPRRVRAGKHRKNEEIPFLPFLRKTTVRSRKSLIFFIIFASFCYASMTQMSFSMDELASPMMAYMILTIGIILAFVTLFLAMFTVMNANKKTIAMMKVFGYSLKDCRKAIISGYRPLSYIGFAVGSVY